MARPSIPKARRKAITLPSMYRHSAAEETRLQLTPHAHLDNLRDGAADRNTWDTIKYRINEGAILASRHFTEHQELHDAMHAAVLALCAIGKRYGSLGRYGCSGDEFRAIGRALDLTDELQKGTFRRQQLAASVLMHRAPIAREAAQ